MQATVYIGWVLIILCGLYQKTKTNTCTLLKKIILPVKRNITTKMRKSVTLDELGKVEDSLVSLQTRILVGEGEGIYHMWRSHLGNRRFPHKHSTSKMGVSWEFMHLIICQT